MTKARRTYAMVAAVVFLPLVLSAFRPVGVADGN